MKTILSLFIVAASVLLADAQEKTIQKSFANIKSIRLSTSSGNISVVKGPGAEVTVTIKHSYDEHVFTPVIEEQGGTLILKEEFSRGSHSGNSSWSLAIPDRIAFAVNSGSGDLQIEGVSTNVTSNLGSGNVEISEVNGKLDFNNGSGDITVENTSGEVSVNTGSGQIKARGGSGAFRFNAGSGDITLAQLSGAFEVNTGSGDIEAENIALKNAGKFNSGSGNAEVVISGSLDHNISINSGSGDATLDFNGAQIEGEIVMTVNERNGEIVAPFKFDKEETITERNSSPLLRKTARLGNKNITVRIGSGSGTAKITK